MRRWILIFVSMAAGCSGGSDGVSVPQLDDFPFGTAHLSWVMPTEREDGTLLLPLDLVETRIYCDGQETPMHIEAAPLTEADVTLSWGWHTCTATVIDQAMLESEHSNTVTTEVVE